MRIGSYVIGVPEWVPETARWFADFLVGAIAWIALFVFSMQTVGIILLWVFIPIVGVQESAMWSSMSMLALIFACGGVLTFRHGNGKGDFEIGPLTLGDGILTAMRVHDHRNWKEFNAVKVKVREDNWRIGMLEEVLNVYKLILVEYFQAREEHGLEAADASITANAELLRGKKDEA